MKSFITSLLLITFLLSCDSSSKKETREYKSQFLNIDEVQVTKRNDDSKRYFKRNLMKDINFDFKTCLTDRFKNIFSNKEVTITVSGLNKEDHSIERVSNVEGCLLWSEKTSYRDLEHQRYIPLTLTFKLNEYSEVFQVKGKLNLWTGDFQDFRYEARTQELIVHNQEIKQENLSLNARDIFFQKKKEMYENKKINLSYDFSFTPIVNKKNYDNSYDEIELENLEVEAQLMFYAQFADKVIMIGKSSTFKMNRELENSLIFSKELDIAVDQIPRGLAHSYYGIIKLTSLNENIKDSFVKVKIDERWNYDDEEYSHYNTLNEAKRNIEKKIKKNQGAKIFFNEKSDAYFKVINEGNKSDAYIIDKNLNLSLSKRISINFDTSYISDKNNSHSKVLPYHSKIKVRAMLLSPKRKISDIENLTDKDFILMSYSEKEMNWNRAAGYAGVFDFPVLFGNDILHLHFDSYILIEIKPIGDAYNQRIEEETYIFKTALRLNEKKILKHYKTKDDFNEWFKESKKIKLIKEQGHALALVSSEKPTNNFCINKKCIKNLNHNLDDDLIKKYFNKELTENEEKELFDKIYSAIAKAQNKRVFQRLGGWIERKLLNTSFPQIIIHPFYDSVSFDKDEPFTKARFKKSSSGSILAPYFRFLFMEEGKGKRELTIKGLFLTVFLKIKKFLGLEMDTGIFKGKFDFKAKLKESSFRKINGIYKNAIAFDRSVLEIRGVSAKRCLYVKKFDEGFIFCSNKKEKNLVIEDSWYTIGGRNVPYNSEGIMVDNVTYETSDYAEAFRGDGNFYNFMETFYKESL